MQVVKYATTIDDLIQRSRLCLFLFAVFSHAQFLARNKQRVFRTIDLLRVVASSDETKRTTGYGRLDAGMRRGRTNTLGEERCFLSQWIAKNKKSSTASEGETVGLGRTVSDLKLADSFIYVCWDFRLSAHTGQPGIIILKLRES